jgi:signal recognition particle receptor subunit beta
VKKSKKCGDNCRKCRNKKKIIIIGDSHAKGSTANIKQVLGKSTEVIGFVSTGAKLNHLTGKANNEIIKLTRKDTVVIWGGAMDIAKNEADEGLAHLLKFVGECYNTKGPQSDMTCGNYHV